MANPSNNKGGSSPAPPSRSRTKRDPSGDKVYRVPPQYFAGTVQRLTGAATKSQAAPAPVAAADETPLRRQSSSSGPPPPPPALSVSTPRSMQEAYLAWCACNNVVLSPGTMAELEHGA